LLDKSPVKTTNVKRKIITPIPFVDFKKNKEDFIILFKLILFRPKHEECGKTYAQLQGAGGRVFYWIMEDMIKILIFPYLLQYPFYTLLFNMQGCPMILLNH
jgi:hypothetical protein